VPGLAFGQLVADRDVQKALKSIVDRQQDRVIIPYEIDGKLAVHVDKARKVIRAIEFDPPDVNIDNSKEQWPAEVHIDRVLGLHDETIVVLLQIRRLFHATLLRYLSTGQRLHIHGFVYSGVSCYD